MGDVHRLHGLARLPTFGAFLLLRLLLWILSEDIRIEETPEGFTDLKETVGEETQEPFPPSSPANVIPHGHHSISRGVGRVWPVFLVPTVYSSNHAGATHRLHMETQRTA